MKKLLAAALAVATVASLSTVSFAATEWEVTGYDQTVAIFDDGTVAAYDGANSVKPDKTLYFVIGDLVYNNAGENWTLS